MQVYTEGRLIVEFTFDDMMRIRSWHFAVRSHRELIPRNILAMQEPGMIESLSKNVTRQGLTSTTLNYLRVSPSGDGAVIGAVKTIVIEQYTVHFRKK